MFLPNRYRVQDEDEILELIRSYPFATIITQHDGEPYINHLPILCDENRRILYGHLARANPQARHIENGQDAWVIFHGPHAYISPRWYRSHDVPTWNYATVHVRGKCRAVDSDRLREILDLSTAEFEKGAWTYCENPNLTEDFKSELSRMILGFEIEMRQVDAKFKLGQNRDAADFKGALEGLAQQGDDMSRAVHALMSRRIPSAD